MHAHNFSFAPDAVFVTGVACAIPAPTLATLRTRAQVEMSLSYQKWEQKDKICAGGPGNTLKLHSRKLSLYLYLRYISTYQFQVYV